MIVGILLGLLDSKSATGTLIRMVCGLFLTIAAIKPVCGFHFEDISIFMQSFDTAAQAASAEGQQMANRTRAEFIKAEAEAYILDKASSYGLQLEVQVTLAEDNPQLPQFVRLTGDASPYARSQLQISIANELGIPKERQIWIG